MKHSVDLTQPIKSEHLISITVSREGALIEADYLEEIIQLGIEEHNAKVRKHGTQDGDYEITVLGMQVTEDLSTQDLVMVLDDEETYSDLSGSSIRVLIEGMNHDDDEGWVKAEDLDDVIFEF